MLPDLIFAAQSAALRVWVDTLGDDDLSAPSTLPGWSVADLLAHLVAVHDAVAALRPATDGSQNSGAPHDPDAAQKSEGPRDPDDPQTLEGPRTPAAPRDPEGAPLTVAEYVAGYVENADRVAAAARTIARDTAADPLRAWDTAAAEARQTLGALGAADRLVTTRRGPMLASAYLTTRIIELVVHADDLHASLPHRPSPPVLPGARHHVLVALREVLTARNGDPAVLAAASALGEKEFLDLATGRTEPGDDVPAALADELPLL